MATHTFLALVSGQVQYIYKQLAQSMLIFRNKKLNKKVKRQQDAVSLKLRKQQRAIDDQKS